MKVMQPIVLNKEIKYQNKTACMHKIFIEQFEDEIKLIKHLEQSDPAFYKQRQQEIIASFEKRGNLLLDYLKLYKK